MRPALQPFRPALAALQAALRPVEWRLGGSGLLAALGLIDEAGDLDVTVPADAQAEVERTCSAWITDVTVGGAPPPWCSDWIVRLDIDGVDVDVIGGFCMVTAAGRIAVPQELGGYLDVDGAPVPLADPAVWWWVYSGYQPEKAAVLAEVVPAERRRIIVRDLGPPAA